MKKKTLFTIFSIMFFLFIDITETDSATESCDYSFNNDAALSAQLDLESARILKLFSKLFQGSSISVRLEMISRNLGGIDIIWFVEHEKEILLFANYSKSDITLKILNEEEKKRFYKIVSFIENNKNNIKPDPDFYESGTDGGIYVLKYLNGINNYAWSLINPLTNYYRETLMDDWGDYPEAVKGLNERYEKTKYFCDVMDDILSFEKDILGCEDNSYVEEDMTEEEEKELEDLEKLLSE